LGNGQDVVNIDDRSLIRICTRAIDSHHCWSIDWSLWLINDLWVCDWPF